MNSPPIYTPDQQRVAEYLVKLMDNQVGAGDDPISFLLASYEQMHAELTETRKLWKVCENFIQAQRIYCEECVYQRDRVIENAYVFIEQVCEIVGYVDLEDEEEEE